MISYDISNDYLRKKVAKTLEGYGVRIQYSVFECQLSVGRYQELYQKLIQLTLGMEQGSIRVYFICENCHKRTVTIGQPMRHLQLLSQNTIII